MQFGDCVFPKDLSESEREKGIVLGWVGGQSTFGALSLKNAGTYNRRLLPKIPGSWVICPPASL